MKKDEEFLPKDGLTWSTIPLCTSLDCIRCYTYIIWEEQYLIYLLHSLESIGNRS